MAASASADEIESVIPQIVRTSKRSAALLVTSDSQPEERERERGRERHIARLDLQGGRGGGG